MHNSAPMSSAASELIFNSEQGMKTSPRTMGGESKLRPSQGVLQFMVKQTGPGLGVVLLGGVIRGVRDAP